MKQIRKERLRMISHVFCIDPTHSVDGDFEILACPMCGGNYLHFDEVHVGGRPRDDGEFENVVVDNTGLVRQNVRSSEMAMPALGDMRRHYISLVADCELCGERFAYALVQHKGQTKVQLIRSEWRSIGHRDSNAPNEP